jgi:hypothetical protein
MHFAKNVFHVSTFFKFNPFNIAFNSGIPDPVAYYDINLIEARDERTKNMHDSVHIK